MIALHIFKVTYRESLNRHRASSAMPTAELCRAAEQRRQQRQHTIDARLRQHKLVDGTPQESGGPVAQESDCRSQALVLARDKVFSTRPRR